MTERHNIPGPGERPDPELVQAEAQIGPIPDGEMIGGDPEQDCHRMLHELTAVEPREAARAGDFREQAARRTSTEHEVSPLARPRADLSERRLDQSAAAQDREQALDSVHDDAGPQSDQC